MRSKAGTCTIIKAALKYLKKTRRKKSITIKIDKEENYTISTVTHVLTNLNTGSVVVSVGIKYCNKVIYPRKFGKRRCNDTKYIERLDTIYKNSYQRCKPSIAEYSRAYYQSHKKEAYERQKRNRERKKDLHKN